MNKIFSAPMSVFLNVTSKCNSRCLYCSSISTNSGIEDFTTDELMDLADTLRKLKVFRIIITGGEPFFRKDILSILEFMTKHHSVWVNTNAQLVSKDIANSLSKFQVKGINVSLDGGDAETNDVVRGQGSFDKTLSGIRLLIENDLPVSIVTIITKYNFRKLRILVDLAESLSVQRIYFNHLSYVGRAEKAYSSLALTPKEHELLLHILRKLKNTHGNLVSGIANSLFSEADFEQLETPKPSKAACLLSCSAGKDACAITADGWVLPCNIFYKLKCGNVRKSDFLDIWQNSPWLHKLRNLADFPTAQVDGCNHCTFNTTCGGGCRAEAYNFYGSLTARDPSCWHSYWNENNIGS